MNVVYTERFKMEFERLPATAQLKFERKIAIFYSDPLHPSLRNHTLQGNLAGMRAFSLTPKIRVVYALLSPSLAKLITVGPHDHVYR